MFKEEFQPFEFTFLNEMASKSKARKLFDQGLRDLLSVGTYYALQDIHKFLFEKVFVDAGELREETLEEELIKIEKMPQSTFDEIVEKFIQMHHVQPFRKGNGISMRIWLDCMFKKELWMVVDWREINKLDYQSAIQHSLEDDTEMKRLLKKALSYDIDNRNLYMQGIDQSYLFEGIKFCKTEDCK